MWKCDNCGKENNDDREMCWSCSKDRYIKTVKTSATLGKGNTDLDKAHEEAKRWWSSSQGDRWRKKGGAVCDANSNHKIRDGEGCLCKPKKVGDSTPDLICDNCFIKNGYAPWEPTSISSQDAEIKLMAQDLRDELRKSGLLKF